MFTTTFTVINELRKITNSVFPNEWITEEGKWLRSVGETLMGFDDLENLESEIWNFEEGSS
jgi:hypothetical protein